MPLKKEVVASNNKHRVLQYQHLKRGDQLKSLYHSNVKHSQELNNRVLTQQEKKNIFDITKKFLNKSTPF